MALQVLNSSSNLLFLALHLSVFFAESEQLLSPCNFSKWQFSINEAEAETCLKLEVELGTIKLKFRVTLSVPKNVHLSITTLSL